MNLIKLAAGAFGTYSTSAAAGFSTADLALFNSLASGGCVVASTAIANQTNLDLAAEISISLVGSGTTTSSSYVAIFVLPLNGDGSTYGDGTPSGSAQAAMPAATYQAGVIGIRAGVSAGTTLVGSCRLWPILPLGAFKLAIGPNLGNALGSAAAAAIQLRTTVLTNNG